MSKFKLSKAMGAVSDDMLLEAMEEKKQRRIGWSVLRAAACLAVVLWIGAVLFGSGTGNRSPFISVIVYAHGGNGVELRLPEENAAVSNVTDEDDLSFDSLPPMEDDQTRFSFAVFLNEYEQQYTDYKVYQDGKEIKKLNTKDLFIGTAFIFDPSQESGDDPYTVSTQTNVTGYTEKKTVIEIHYLKEDGALLLRCVISVTPQEDEFLIVLEEVYVPNG